MSELLFEIGCEELPASYAVDALKALPEIVARELSERGLKVAASDVRVAGTARRLAAGIAKLPDATPKEKKTYTGPPKAAAYKDGKPTKAAEGFAAKYGVGVDKLKIVTTDKGEYLGVDVDEGGKPTRDVLAEALPKVIEAIPFPKSMRWADLEVKFARPVRWLLAAFGGKAVPFKWGNLTAGTKTQGHRFLAPGAVEATTWSEWEKALEKAHVIADPEKRRAATRAAAEKAAKDAGGVLENDDALLTTVSFLVEEPHPITGTFDAKLLELPREVIVTPMKHHQRYFPVTDAGYGTTLKAAFVTIANVPPRDPKVVARGNESVLRARLADAKYFFDLDLKTPLDEMAKGLARMTFQAKLGTYAEKVDRVRDLALEIRRLLENTIGSALPPESVIDRGARLAKADLQSKMVFEFPELQGLMGREYARRAAEKSDVADAIAEHYQPRHAGDTLPKSHAGAILSIADRLDTIVGTLAIGERPSGSKDPFGLRRHALAILAIVRDKGYRLSTKRLFAAAANAVAPKTLPPGAKVEGPHDGAWPSAIAASEYLAERLENQLREEGLPYDAVQAALAADLDDVVEAVARARAIAELKKLPELEPVAIGFKRAQNILAKAKPNELGASVDASLFKHDAEKALHDVATKVAGAMREQAKAGRWSAALGETVKLKAPIDAFYAAVMVNDDDLKIRRNRLALLQEVVKIFAGIADFTKLVVAGDEKK